MKNSNTISFWVILVWRALLFLVVVGIVCAVFAYHIPLSGEKDVHTAFDGPKGSISFVYPVSRVKDRERGEDGVSFIRMVEDPVYIDVHTRVPFDSARLDVTYINTTSIPLQMGIKLQEGSNPAILLKSFEHISQKGNWSRASVSFDLTRAKRYNGKYTVVFSAPGLVTEKNIPGELRLAEMTVHLKRKAFSWDDMAN